MASSRPWTYRIQHIAPGTTAEQLRSYFDSDGYSLCEIKSLVPAADHTDGTLVATVSYTAKDGNKVLPQLKDPRLRIDAEFYGLTALNQTIEPSQADLVAVTGLAGHAFGSWASDRDAMWVRDFLPTDFPNISIYTYGYDSTLWQPSSRTILADHADAFAQRRESETDQMKALCQLAESPDSRDILSSSSAIFFGAPNGGLETTALETLVKGQPAADLVDQLKPDSPTLRDLSRDFIRVSRDMRVLAIYELQKTKTVIRKPDGKWSRDEPLQMMVDYQSATRNLSDKQSLPCDRDHSGIAKVERGEASIYPSISRFISESLIRDEPPEPPEPSGLRPRKFSEKEIMDSLYFPQMENREDEISDAHRTTFEWVFRDSSESKTTPRKLGGYDPHNQPEWYSLSKWLAKDSNVYWISGKAGSGKSTLMRFISGHPRTKKMLKEWAKSSSVFILQFYFWSAGVNLQKSVQGLLRSLIHQILEKKPELKKAAKFSERRLPWNERNLTANLKRIINHDPDSFCFCLFVDGLDESNEDYQDLVDLLFQLDSASNCKICVSSRPLETFKKRFGTAPRLRLQDLTIQDITKMINDRLRPRLELAYTAEEKVVNRLCSQLGESAEGIFLWATLMVQYLTEAALAGQSLEELQNVIDHTPRDIEQLYTYMLGKLDANDMESAALYLNSMIHWYQGSEPSYLSYYSRREFWGTLLVMTLADEDNWKKVSTQVSRSAMEDALMRTARVTAASIHKKCGGILEVDEEKGNVTWERHMKKSSGRVDGAAFMRQSRDIRFIHKTAFDYVRGNLFKSLIGGKLSNVFPLKSSEAYMLSGAMRTYKYALTLPHDKYQLRYPNQMMRAVRDRGTYDDRSTLNTLGVELDRAACEGKVNCELAENLVTDLDWVLHLPGSKVFSVLPNGQEIDTRTPFYDDPPIKGIWKSEAYRPLGWAAFNSFNHFVTTMLQSKVSLESDELNLLLWCVVNKLCGRTRDIGFQDSYAISKTLVEKGANPNEFFTILLPRPRYMNSHTGNSHMGKRMSTFAACCNQQGNWQASSQSNEAASKWVCDLLNLLVDAGGDVNASIWTGATYVGRYPSTAGDVIFGCAATDVHLFFEASPLSHLRLQRKFFKGKVWPAAALRYEDALISHGAMEMFACRVIQFKVGEEYALTKEESDAMVRAFIDEPIKSPHMGLYWRPNGERERILRDIRKRTVAADKATVADGVLVVPHWTGEQAPEPPNIPAVVPKSSANKIYRRMKNSFLDSVTH
ncbi:MAG: hypothetical protein M1820_010293 [Bogoriella megaspora]|nr:MAG: hypothetical protein M1820_010293 [Bogoriella megaspora]